MLHAAAGEVRGDGAVVVHLVVSELRPEVQPVTEPVGEQPPQRDAAYQQRLLLAVAQLVDQHPEPMIGEGERAERLRTGRAREERLVESGR